ncbi:MAG: citrate (Si)-synthase [Rhodospirillales bacterium]|nr:citrate (Si)-synthase [Rhodospirillales bacterium]MCB9995032.1 citrate (Si)-synthase [Rhodospirillales bacterium]
MSHNSDPSTVEKNRYTLIDNKTGQTAQFSRINPTYGKPAIDLSGPIDTEKGPAKGGLRAVFQIEAHDPAYKSTSSCLSEITYIDGEEGVLLHRGYNIKDLTQNATYMDVVHLLLEGTLPGATEKEKFEQKMVGAMRVPKVVEHVIRGFDRDDSPMDMLAAAMSAASAKSDDSNPRAVIAQLPAIVAMVIRHQQGKDKFLAPDTTLGFTENFVRMAFADDDGTYKINKVLTESMDKLLILHADHEQNASTSEVRGARSAGSKMAASIAAGVITLAGPLHGGANQKVLEQLEQIANTNPGQSLDEKIAGVIAKAKDPNDDFRLMGFGHRVYKNTDPRATVLKAFVDNLLQELNVKDERLDIAMKLEQAALADPYFKDRKLFPNVDFYSGIAMAAMGMKPELFTLIFAAGRVSGWTAQAEELDRSKQPICRPRQQYVGDAERPVPKR